MAIWDQEINQNLSNISEEAYKVLRANIQFCEYDSKIKTIAVTSYNPGEGKTTTSINLGISIAKSGVKVLYVDADLRKPMMMKNLKSEDFKGLSKYLSGYASLDDIINKTNIEGFSFIACGTNPFNPSELISSKKFEELMEKLKDRSDMIIIDTPPLGSVIDAAIVASKTDGTIIVVKPGILKLKNLQMMKEQLEKADAKILGVVLNNLKKVEYKDYYNGYDYYGSQKKYVESWLNQKRRQ
jgi:protein-tyrosine kinase